MVFCHTLSLVCLVMQLNVHVPYLSFIHHNQCHVILVSCRISLIPSPMLRHHSSTILDLPSCSRPFHHVSSLLVHSIHTINIPILHYHFQHLRFSPYFPISLCTLFLSLVPRFSPSFSVSIHSPFLPFHSPFLPVCQLDIVPYQTLLLTDLFA